MPKFIIIFITLLHLAITLIFSTDVDQKLEQYKKTKGKRISGKLTCVGSDTLLNLMTYWSEGFSKAYPGVKSEIEGKGSSTAPPALISGASLFGPMSRAMKSKEVDGFVAKFGYKPTSIIVAIDTIAIYVNKDNPIQGLTIEEADAVFSKTRNHGYSKNIKTWEKAGVSQWKNIPISIYGRNSASGTYGYFKKIILKKGDYKDIVKEQPGSASVVQGIENDLYGIGYSGIGYITSGVKVIGVGKDKSSIIKPSVETALNGKYPLARPLLVYINKKPGKKLSPMVIEFFRYVLSKEGQEIVIKDGFIPLPGKIIMEQLKKLK